MMKSSFSLSELCVILDESIRRGMPDTYWVRAEIAQLTEKGHCYLELVEKGDKGLFAAKMRATCWSHVWQLLSAFFVEETGQHLTVGMQVLVEVEVSYHPVYGLSLNILNINPSYTMGDLARQRQRTLQQLEKDGVLEMNKQTPLPAIVRRIALISAEDAAGYGDFCHQLEANEYGFMFTSQLFPAVMQGEQAPCSIIAALRTIAGQAEEFDCVAIIRGGGASTDLTCFDNYELASHCAQFPLPILSGIGHTRDVSIVDMVVHTALKTPTAVAEMIISHNARQLERLNELKRRLAMVATTMLSGRKQQVEQLKMRLHYVIAQTCHDQRNKLQLLNQTIAFHSPERIFKKGYSLTLCNGQVVKQAMQLHEGMRITSVFADGEVDSIVQL